MKRNADEIMGVLAVIIFLLSAKLAHCDDVMLKVELLGDEVVVWSQDEPYLRAASLDESAVEIRDAIAIGEGVLARQEIGQFYLNKTLPRESLDLNDFICKFYRMEIRQVDLGIRKVAPWSWDPNLLEDFFAIEVVFRGVSPLHSVDLEATVVLLSDGTVVSPVQRDLTDEERARLEEYKQHHQEFMKNAQRAFEGLKN